MENKKNIVLLSTIIALYWFSQYIYMPFLTPHLLSLGLTASVAGVIAGAYGLTQLCFRFPIGIFTDRTQQYVWIMRIGILLSFLSSMGFYMVSKPELLFVSNFLQGLSSSTWLSFVVLYSKLFRENEYQKAMGFSNALNQGGILISYFLGGWLMDDMGIYPLFLISAGVAFLVFTVTFFLKIPNEISKQEGEKIQTFCLKEVFKKEMILYSLMGLTAMFVAFGTAFSFTSTRAEQLGASGNQLAVVAMLFTMAAALGSFLVSSPLVQKSSSTRIVLLCLLGMFLCCVGIGNADTLIEIMAIQVVLGISIYMLFSYAVSKATKKVSSASKSTAMGVFQTIYSAGIFLGPVFVGRIAQSHSLPSAFCAIAWIPIFGMGIYLLYMKVDKGGVRR